MRSNPQLTLVKCFTKGEGVKNVQKTVHMVYGWPQLYFNVLIEDDCFWIILQLLVKILENYQTNSVLFFKSNRLLKMYFTSLNRTRNWCVGEDDAGYDASWWRNEKPQLQFQTWKILLGRPETTVAPICPLIGSLQNGLTLLALDMNQIANKRTQMYSGKPRMGQNIWTCIKSWSKKWG